MRELIIKLLVGIRAGYLFVSFLIEAGKQLRREGRPVNWDSVKLQMLQMVEAEQAKLVAEAIGKKWKTANHEAEMQEVELPEAEKERGFVNLDEWEEPHGRGEAPADWEPQPDAIWAMDGGAQQEMRRLEIETLHLVPEEGDVDRQITIGFPERGWWKNDTVALRVSILKPRSDYSGYVVHRHYMQGYDAGGFLLDPQLHGVEGE